MQQKNMVFAAGKKPYFAFIIVIKSRALGAVIHEKGPLKTLEKISFEKKREKIKLKIIAMKSKLVLFSLMLLMANLNAQQGNLNHPYSGFGRPPYDYDTVDEAILGTAFNLILAYAFNKPPRISEYRVMVENEEFLHFSSSPLQKENKAFQSFLFQYYWDKKTRPVFLHFTFPLNRQSLLPEHIQLRPGLGMPTPIPMPEKNPFRFF